MTLTLFAGAVSAYLFYREITKGLPPVEQIVDYRPPVVSKVYAKDETLVGEFFLEKRYLTPLDEIPPIVRQAFIAAEDAEFYEHSGIDLYGIARALAANLRAGEVVQGGSTITQQVVKMLLLSPQKSYERKLKEIILALRLEQQLSKDEILYLYLNQIYLGNGAYGVTAAAQEYFGKPVGEVGLAEASLLAGLPQAPSRYSPVRHPERARRRQLYVLRRMVHAGYISESERKAAKEYPLTLESERTPSYRHAPWYVEHTRRFLQERYGSAAAYQLGLQIHTALDLELQRAAQKAVRKGLVDLDRRRGYRGPSRRLAPDEVEDFLDQQQTHRRGPPTAGDSVEAVVTGTTAEAVNLGLGTLEANLPAANMEWAGGWNPSRFEPGDVLLVRIDDVPDDGPLEVSLDQEPVVEGALIALDPTTGLVRAMVGGYDFGRSQFNRAIQAYRQPGSAFKPFLYSAAFDREFTPASIILDAPVVYEEASFVWKPENYTERWHGATRLRDALTYSRNVVTVKLAERLGLPYLFDYLLRFEFSRPLPRNLSIALGSSEVSLLELVRAYGAFATLGEMHDPVFIQRITDQNGNILETRESEAKQILSPETAYLVTSVLEDVVRRGTGKQARVLARPVAGKTGTTNDLMDAWFVGFTPDLVVGAWVGHDSKKSLGRHETGGRAALPIWLDFMKTVLDDRPVQDFSVPDGVTFVNIDKATGLRATSGSDGTLLEAFRRGTAPSRFAYKAERVEKEDFFLGNF